MGMWQSWLQSRSSKSSLLGGSRVESAIDEKFRTVIPDTPGMHHPHTLIEGYAIMHKAGGKYGRKWVAHQTTLLRSLRLSS